MNAGDFYRIEFRIQNSVRKYYLVREIFTDAKKFSASRLITSGTPPTRTETDRCASLYGFDLELKCIAKAAKYRTGIFRFEQFDDTDAVFEIERFRLLNARKMQMKPADRFPAYAASVPGVSFSEEEIAKLFSAGTIPRGKTLAEVNLVQNLYNAWQLRDGKLPSASKIFRLHAVLQANLGRPPLSPSLRLSLESLLLEFFGKIKDGFYPFEQCLLLRRELTRLMPDDPVFAGEVCHRCMTQFGYCFTLTEAETLPHAVSVAEEENPALEYDVRELHELMFRVNTGGKQKQLELF